MRRRIKIIVLVVAGIALVPIVCIAPIAPYLFPMPVIAPWPSNMADCEQVGRSFIMQLAVRDLNAAKKLSAPDQWGRIAAWMTSHGEGLKWCQIDEPDTNGLFTGGSKGGSEMSGFYLCFMSHYRLDVENIRTKQSSGVCKVVDWSASEEFQR